MFRIVVRGVVQGVGFRPSVKRAADALGSRGFVRNDGSHVTIETDIDPVIFMEKIEEIIGPMAMIEEWTFEETSDPSPEDFMILSSTKGERDSSLPPDTAICNRCLEEMLNPEDRRYGYPFTNCTDCGARYTLIEGLPYDRERTSMSDFVMCEECRDEYTDRSFRRFHAQTLSCPHNGPRYRYLDRDLKELEAGPGAFEKCARELAEGKVLVVKGWGGMHIISHPDRISYLREWYGRPYKPFAVMARDLASAREFAEIPEHCEKALTSPARPVVLLKKRRDLEERLRYDLEMISPGIDTVGTYLPYSGIHHLLFKELEKLDDSLKWMIMTSANPPGEPMALELESARVMKADGYLIHDRRISARCDDSVIVSNPFGSDLAHSRPGPFGIRSFPIRKARGLIPDPIPMPHRADLLSFGAERNVTISVTRNGRVFTSPYIGNSRHPEVIDHASRTAERFMDLFGVRDVEAVCADLHPRYETRSLASEFAERYSVPVRLIQHHEAHAASLLADSGLEHMPVVVMDGVGYGNDGLPWGGEIIDSSFEKMERIGHLENFGLPGGDASVYHPERIAHWLFRRIGSDLDLGDEKLNGILKRTHSGAIMTSSMGRLLDAMSSLLLGITWRTYDGEPAMRLERLLSGSKDPKKDIFEIPVKDGVVDVTGRWRILVEECFRGDLPTIGMYDGSGRLSDLSMGMVSSIVHDMVKVAIGSSEGDRKDGKIPYVGISGGVAYNLPIVRAFVDSCHEQNAFPVLHSRVPPGDGGISTGQAALGGSLPEKVI